MGASRHCPNPQQGIYSLVSTHLIWLFISLSNPGPNCPSPAGFVFHQWNPRALCPKFSTAENAPGSSHHSTLKTLWWVFWEGSLVHRRIYHISFLRLFCSALSQHQTSVTYTSHRMFTRHMGKFSDIYLSNLLTFTQRFLFQQYKSQDFPYTQSSRMAFLAGVNAPWAPALLRTSKKTHQGKPQKYTKAAQNSADQKCLPWNQQTFQRKHTVVLPARSPRNILF